MLIFHSSKNSTNTARSLVALSTLAHKQRSGIKQFPSHRLSIPALLCLPTRARGPPFRPETFSQPAGSRAEHSQRAPLPQRVWEGGGGASSPRLLCLANRRDAYLKLLTNDEQARGDAHAANGFEEEGEGRRSEREGGREGGSEEMRRLCARVSDFIFPFFSHITVPHINQGARVLNVEEDGWRGSGGEILQVAEIREKSQPLREGSTAETTGLSILCSTTSSAQINANPRVLQTAS